MDSVWSFLVGALLALLIAFLVLNWWTITTCKKLYNTDKCSFTLSVEPIK